MSRQGKQLCHNESASSVNDIIQLVCWSSLTPRGVLGRPGGRHLSTDSSGSSRKLARWAERFPRQSPAFENRALRVVCNSTLFVNSALRHSFLSDFLMKRLCECRFRQIDLAHSFSGLSPLSVVLCIRAAVEAIAAIPGSLFVVARLDRAVSADHRLFSCSDPRNGPHISPASEELPWKPGLKQRPDISSLPAI